MGRRLPAPDLLIGLSSSTAVLRDRVYERGREMGSSLTRAQLDTLSAAFDHTYAQWSRSLIRVDATAFDVFDKRHLNELAARVRQFPILREPR